MPTVFITNDAGLGRYDLQGVSAYGTPVYITRGRPPLATLTNDIIEQLIKSTPNDFIAPSGSSVIAAMCMAVWLEMHPKAIILDMHPQAWSTHTIYRSAIRSDAEKVRDIHFHQERNRG